MARGNVFDGISLECSLNKTVRLYRDRFYKWQKARIGYVRYKVRQHNLKEKNDIAVKIDAYSENGYYLKVVRSARTEKELISGIISLARQFLSPDEIINGIYDL